MGTLAILLICLVPSAVSTSVLAFAFQRELKRREKAHQTELAQIVSDKDGLLRDAEGRIEQLEIDLAAETRNKDLAEKRLKHAEEPFEGRHKARNWAEVRRFNDQEKARQEAIEEGQRDNTKQRAG